jgi:hypothetical protein
MIGPDNPPTENAPEEGSSESAQGDFDEGANTLWTLYGKEAKEFDEAHIQTLKDDMDSILLFVRLNFVYLSNDLSSCWYHRPVYLPLLLQAL